MKHIIVGSFAKQATDAQGDTTGHPSNWFGLNLLPEAEAGSVQASSQSTHKPPL
jgi:hypothetical protein